MSRASIVIPCYNNAPEHLEASVQSARGQTHDDVEIILVDDGSTRPETLAKTGDWYGVHLIRRENGGTGSALNSGVRAATGEFILPLGADDLIAQDFISVLLNKITRASADVVGIYPDVHFIGGRSGVAVAPEAVVPGRHSREKQGHGTRNLSPSPLGTHWRLRRVQRLLGGLVLLGRTGDRMIQEPRARLCYRIGPNSRNPVNREIEGKRNARRHIAEPLRDQVPEMFLAAAEQADAALAEAALRRVRGWMAPPPRLARPSTVHKYVHPLLPRVR